MAETDLMPPIPGAELLDPEEAQRRRAAAALGGTMPPVMAYGSSRPPASPQQSSQPAGPPLPPIGPSPIQPRSPANNGELAGRAREIALGATSQPRMPAVQPPQPGAPPDSAIPPIKPPANAIPAVGVSTPNTLPQPRELQPGGDRDFSGATAAPVQPGASSAMPPVKLGPAAQREQDLLAKGPPQPKWWQKALEIAGSIHPLGRLIESQIPSTPIGYNTQLNAAAMRAAKEQGLTTGQQGIEAGQRAAQTAQENTRAGREAFLKQNPDVQLTPFERADFLTTGKMPQREPTAPKEPSEPKAATLQNLMTGNNGGPQINPETQKPYTQLEALAAVEKVPQEAKTPPLTASQIDQLNTAMTDRYHVLNSEKPLPKEFTLSSNATQKDYDRIDKIMESVERAQGTKAQQNTANSIREQAAQLAKQNAQDRETQQDLKWVMWQEPSGKVVAGPLSLAKQMKAENPSQLDTRDVQAVMDARGAINLINKKGDEKTPETMGVLQLAESLKKDDKMGVFASRYNNFLTKGVGASPGDDPRIITLLDKAPLMATLIMKAHFGASGGRSPQMLQHFLNLADAGKMDAETFIGGAKTLADYMQDRAMMPSGSGKGGKVQSFADWKKSQGQ